MVLPNKTKRKSIAEGGEEVEPIVEYPVGCGDQHQHIHARSIAVIVET